jgi:hypothetical protein
MSETCTILVANRARLSASRFEELERAVCRHRTVKDALNWLMALSPPRTICDLVTQDEFSHDALAEFAPDLWISWSVS